MKKGSGKTTNRRQKINWLNHFIELVVVVIGITLAFMLNNWREGYVDHQLEKKYLNSFMDDLNFDRVQLDSLILYNETKLKDINRLITFLKNKDVENDSVLIVFAQMMMFTPFDPNVTTYQSIKNAGDFGLISDYRLKENLIKYYQNLESKKYFDNLFNSYLNDYIIPFALENINFEEQRFVNRKNLLHYRFKNLTIGYYRLLNQYLDYYKNLREECTQLLSQLKERGA